MGSTATERDHVDVLIVAAGLAREGFGASIQAAEVGAERETMGRYAPRSRYYESAAAYDEAHPC